MYLYCYKKSSIIRVNYLCFLLNLLKLQKNDEEYTKTTLFKKTLVISMLFRNSTWKNQNQVWSKTTYIKYLIFSSRRRVLNKLRKYLHGWSQRMWSIRKFPQGSPKRQIMQIKIWFLVFSWAFYFKLKEKQKVSLKNPAQNFH